jgi:uncharacterized repeat protein (TIGR03803 family)
VGQTEAVLPGPWSVTGPATSMAPPYRGGDLTCNRGVDCGTVFKLDTAGRETVLHSFTQTGGRRGLPDRRLARDHVYPRWLFQDFHPDWRLVNVKNRYLGVMFKIKGKIHYGWARLSVQVQFPLTITATLTGYAYETIPNKAIIAGKTKGPEDSAEQPATLGRLALGRR